MKKPRSNSKLEWLPANQRARLIGLLRTKAKYAEIVAAMERAFGLKTSTSAVSNFYSRHMADVLVPSVGLTVTITSPRPGEIIVAFDAPPLERGPEDETALGSVPATYSGSSVQVSVVQVAGENGVRLVAYPLPLLDPPSV